MLKQPFTFLKLLLIAILVIQPVAMSYAMTNMAHHDQGKMSAPHGHNMSMMPIDAEENAATSPHLAADVVTIDMTNETDSDNSSDNCCTTPACNAAVMSTYLMPQYAINPDNDIAFHLLWKSTALLSEKKPPRNLLD